MLLASLLTISLDMANADEVALRGLVRSYLDEPDADRADKLLKAILNDPDASVPVISGIIREGRSYGPQPTGSQPSRPIRIKGRTYQYALYVPTTYDPAKPYALLLCLHGGGFTGDTYLERWQTRLGEQYILACPTVIQGDWWTRQAADLVLATIREVRARYHIDPDRIFLTGMSNGGIGVYLIGTQYAPLFAGLAPMAGGLDDVLLPLLENLRNTPVYVIHGSNDGVMPVSLSRTIAEELRRLGYPFIYREHDRIHPLAGGHFFPREELPDLVAWFDGRRRNPLPVHLTVVRDASHLVPFAWVRIDATERIAAFTDLLIDSRDELVRRRVYAKLDATVVGPNRIEVNTEHVRRYSLYLNADLVDFSQPLTIVTNGRITYEGAITPSAEVLLRDARHRHDPQMLFPVVIPVAVSEG